MIRFLQTSKKKNNRGRLWEMSSSFDQVYETAAKMRKRGGSSLRKRCEHVSESVSLERRSVSVSFHSIEHQRHSIERPFKKNWTDKRHVIAITRSHCVKCFALWAMRWLHQSLVMDQSVVDPWRYRCLSERVFNWLTSESARPWRRPNSAPKIVARYLRNQFVEATAMFIGD